LAKTWKASNYIVHNYNFGLTLQYKIIICKCSWCLDYKNPLNSEVQTKKNTLSD